MGPCYRASRHWLLPTSGAVVAALLLFTSCSGAYAGPAGTERKVRFSPPVLYMHWWAEMEECSGASRPFGAVEWYFVPADDLARLQGGAIGLTWPTRDRIYLPPGNMYAKGVVQHEMLHALGFRGHPIPPFGSCAPAWGWLP